MVLRSASIVVSSVVTAAFVFGWTDAALAASDSLALRRLAHKARQPAYEIGMRPHHGGAAIVRHAGPHRQLAIFDIQLHQGFGMFADKGDRGHDHTLAVAAGARDFRIGGGTDPLQRSHPALVTNHGFQL